MNFTNRFPLLPGLAFFPRAWETSALAGQTSTADSPQMRQLLWSVCCKAVRQSQFLHPNLQAGSARARLSWWLLRLTCDWGRRNAFIFPKDVGLFHPEDVEDFWIVLEVSQDPDLLAVSKAYCGTFKNVHKTFGILPVKGRDQLFSPWIWAWLRSLILTNRMWPTWWWVISEARL